MRSRSLISYYSLRPYPVCPDSKSKYTIDPKTRKRQVPIIILVLVTMGLTFAVGLKGSAWLLPTVASHIILWIYIGYALSMVTYIKYPD